MGHSRMGLAIVFCVYIIDPVSVVEIGYFDL